MVRLVSIPMVLTNSSSTNFHYLSFELFRVNWEVLLLFDYLNITIIILGGFKHGL